MLGATSSSFVVEVPLFSTVEVLDLSSPVLPLSISVLGPSSISEILTEILVSSAETQRVRDRRQSIVTIIPAAAVRGRGLTRPNCSSAKHEMSTSHQTSPK